MLLIVTGCVGNAFQCCMLLTLSSPCMHDVQTYLCEFAHAILLDIHSAHWSCRAAAMRIQDCHQQAVAKHTHRNCQAKLPGRQESNVRLLKRRQLKSLSTLMASDKLTHRTEGLLVGDQLTARSHNNNLQRAPLLFSSHVLNRVCLQRKFAHCTSTTSSTTAHYVRTKVQGTPSAGHFNTIICRQRCVHGPNPQRACAWSLSHICTDLQESLPAIQQRHPLLSHPLKRGYLLSSIVKTSLWLSNRSGPIQIIACAPHVACAAVLCSTNGFPLPG